MEPTRKKTTLNDYAIYSNMGFEMAAVIALGVFGGVKLDKVTGCSPLFTIILSLASVAIALYLMIRNFIPKKENKENESKDTH